MPTLPVKVIVEVRGGLVQAVHSDAPGAVEVSVFDLDAASFETPAEEAEREGREKEYNRAIEGMTAIY